MEIVEGFVKFWRVLLRFFLGLLFILTIFSIPFWAEILVSCQTILPLIITKVDLNILQILAFILSILLISVIGIFFLESAIIDFGLLLRFILKWQRFFSFVDRHNFISNLILPIPTLARKIYKDRSEEILRYHYLKNWSRVAEIEHYFEKLSTHTTNISEHINTITNPDTIEYIDYYSSVSQEQVKRDHLRDEIRDIYYFMIVLFSILVLVLIRKLFSPSISILAFISLEALLIPIINYKRFRFAIYIMIGYIDNFTIGEGASVEDRDAI